ncbi:ImmA/IrrE family metallo-endopeptidase [Sinorhizobium saheli]|uniref:ImmA/IrrE family metallo-endopeptidase n=1 Tax=Sinorhizobium saheli TaxID=36856 RepID=UPI001294D3A2|nr:ImmA/IrrE family metallo-endopeptidase [Sinorhizobium saheli]MQW85990.1 ImmA/IrrE family metallo-endopeptidase [Sinorhizobium saheli]
MVRYVRDTTGRFSQRPHYKPEELDRECENIITSFLNDKHGKTEFPVTTDDLTLLIERDTDDFDPYADLSVYGNDVEGVTEFQPGRKPIVRIADSLSSDERRENRLRTTLTHEYGHVHFHAYLWEFEPPGTDLLRRNPNANKQICKRDTMIEANQTDWMEWQAGHACGALLMPVSYVRRVVGDYQEANRLFGVIGTGSEHGQALIARIQEAFQVSADAARVRLLRLNILGEASAGPSLFDNL